MQAEPQAPPPKATVRRVRRVRRVILLLAVAVDALGMIVARRRGYKLGPNTLVRCRRGHVFSTIWIPGASVKSLRLGWFRFQRCPVGGHWTLVHPVRERDLGFVQRRRATARRDVRIP